MTREEYELRDAVQSILRPGGGGIPASLEGWTDGPASAMRREVRQEILGAIRMSDTPEGQRAELERWQEQPAPAVWVRGRIALLEEQLERRSGAASVEVVEDPLPESSDYLSEPPDQSQTIKPDPTSASPEFVPVQSGQPQRSRDETRQTVRDMLGTGVSNREIARRLGISPSTVAAVQKAMA